MLDSKNQVLETTEDEATELGNKLKILIENQELAIKYKLIRTLYIYTRELLRD